MSLVRPALAAAVVATLLGLAACGGTTPTTTGCNSVADCPRASGSCVAAACQASECVEVPKAAGTRISDPVAGDCQSNQCDGAGHQVSAAAPTDVPPASGQCTIGVCTAGAPAQSDRPVGTACNENGGAMCDGAGTCVECVAGTDCPSGVCTAGTCAPVPSGCSTVADCPGASGPCATPACQARVCVEVPVALGTFVSDPSAGDCQSNQCDGAGHMISAPAPTDLPAASGQCTFGQCTAGAPTQGNQPINTPCTENGGIFCDGSGVCVQCNANADCTSGVCATHTCAAATCSDGIKNGLETGIDCGGTCAPCADGVACLVPGDCTSHVCTGLVCQAPSCADGVRNGTETDVDCGGASCGACADNQVCRINADCTSGLCQGGVCTAKLGQGSACTANGECTNGLCVDNFCCDKACAGTCESCSLAGKQGTCTPALNGTDPRGQCPAASCTNATATPVALCDGAGACTTPTPASCPGNLVCGATTCLTTCSSDADCVPGHPCDLITTHTCQ
jgi:hypothetical protein